MHHRIQMLALILMTMLISSIQLASSSQESMKHGKLARPGVPPSNEKDCPPTHPIKGNFTTYSGEHCIYHGKLARPGVPPSNEKDCRKLYYLFW